MLQKGPNLYSLKQAKKAKQQATTNLLPLLN